MLKILGVTGAMLGIMLTSEQVQQSKEIISKTEDELIPAAKQAALPKLDRSKPNSELLARTCTVASSNQSTQQEMMGAGNGAWDIFPVSADAQIQLPLFLVGRLKHLHWAKRFAITAWPDTVKPNVYWVGVGLYRSKAEETLGTLASGEGPSKNWTRQVSQQCLALAK